MSEAANIAMLQTPVGAERNLSNLLRRAAEAHPDSCALIYEDQAIDYAELERRSQRAATYLRELGVEHGDRVGLQIPNCPAFVALYFGILKLGATVVPQSPLATLTELSQNMGDAEAKLVLCLPLGATPPSRLPSGARVVLVPDDDGLELFGDRPPLETIAAVRDDETAVILYTSGTTGRPKGAELTHSNLGLNALAAIEIYSLVPEDIVLGVLPLYHSYGQTCTLNGTIAVGARAVLVKRFEADRVAQTVDRHAVSVFLGVPTMFADMAHCPPQAGTFASLRLCGAGGAPLHPEIRRRFEQRAGAPLFETYGLSETSPIASINRRGDEQRAGTIGWPIVGTEMRIAAADKSECPVGEVGEIAIRGHNIMKGYWRNPQATAEAIDAEGWFYSGDLGTMDEDRCFRVVGRLKDLIIRGGFNVYPREIEDVLHSHPAVRLAAVVGVRDERLGEEVGAAVVLEDDAQISEAELCEWARERLAAHKRPRIVWFVDELPLGPTGKILKRLISAPATPGTSASSHTSEDGHD